MLQNTYLCPLHSQIATHFCFCQSPILHLCESCLSKHENHEIYQMKHFELFQTLSMDQAAFQSRLVTYQRCSEFLDLLIRCEAEAQNNAELVLRRVTEVFQDLMDRRHRSFEDVMKTLKEETDLLLLKAKPRVSPLALALQTKSEELEWKHCQVILQCTELRSLEETLNKAVETCSGSQRMWLLEYEAQLLAVFSTASRLPVQTPTESPASPLLPTSITPQSADSLIELQSPLPDFLTRAAKDTLQQLGPYPAKDEESSLVKRGPVSVEDGVYIGQWNSKQQRHGYGQQIWPNGLMYEGQWRYGKRSGKGRFIGPKGEAYIGDFEEDSCNGYIEEFQPDGSQYSGTFKAGKRDGFGCYRGGSMTKYSGSVYYGAWEKGCIQGKGVRFFEDGSSYAGEWRGGREDGKGVFSSAAGTLYHGSYKAGECSGSGVCVWTASGHIYRGDWKAGKRSGTGCLTFPGKEKWEGLWADDQQVSPICTGSV